MIGLELVVVLGVAVLLGNAVGDRYRIAPPVVLLVLGALLGFVPALREVELPPEAVLLIFLPVLLYWESLTTSLREIRRDLRGIILMSTVLVIGTAGAVAAVAHELGLAWGPAWVLGAAVAPTDATAVGVLAKALPAATSPCCAPRASSTTAPRWCSSGWPSASRSARSTSPSRTSPRCSPSPMSAGPLPERRPHGW